jgi:iron(III) transport system ATP-binding protein
MNALSVKNISYAYGNNKILKNVSFDVSRNEIVCLLGVSGCGKTTTLRTIAGLIEPASGNIIIDGNIVFDHGVCVPPEKRELGMVFQDHSLFPHLTVAGNIEFGIKYLAKKARQLRMREMLSLVQMPDVEKRYPHELSGGQQQRIAIARAMARQPKLMLLDEPFSNIDHQTRFQIIGEVKDIFKTQGVAAIFVTHNEDEATAFSDRLIRFNEGEIYDASQFKS